MSMLAPDRWRVLSKYLDEGLDMPDAARQHWLDALAGTDPDIAADVRALLDEHRVVERERFLEAGPVLQPLPGLAGQTVGAYTLVAPVGQGGMGTVWRAERSDGRFNRQVAIKLLNPAILGRGGEERFTREGRILARLTHPLIAQLIDAGVAASGQPYFVLEYVAGEHIDRYCEQQVLDVRARIELFLDVLTAVAHAHANLVVHRDVKPSNVLVTADGRVKLLDFGIAKLLEDDSSGNAMNLTREVPAALTPAYAAPEQLTGEGITTATDVYALGVLLYTLLSGHHPLGDAPRSTAEIVKAIVDVEPDTLSSSAGRPFDRDLETIVAKALKKRPHERYPSVAAMADDLRRFLNYQPIAARPDTILYRTAKFVRRNRVPVTATACAAIALAMGVYEINRERMIADRRFVDVRQLANKLFDIDVLVRQLPGSSKTRQAIVDTSLDYLRRLGAEVQGDPQLALEIGTAYMRVARVQGVPISPNLGQSEQAERNLRTADAYVRSVLAGQPGNRTALLRMAQINHDRMILAGNRRPADEALPLAEQASSWMAKYIDSGPVDRAETQQVLLAMNNIANRFRIERRYDEALSLGYRAIDLAAKLNEPLQGGSLLMNTAYIHRDRGELNEALTDIRRAVQVLTSAETSAIPDQGRMANLALALSREGAILGEIDHVSLWQPTDAIAPLQRSFQISDDYTHRDATDSLNRGHLQPAVMTLARILRDSDPARSLALYDHLTRHLGEIKNNAQFRRYESRALAASTYPLTTLHRMDEARQRLDEAFRKLTELKLYPAQQVALGSEIDDAMRARGDLQAAAGDIAGAIRTYTTLLDLVTASKPTPDDDLADATDLSRLYASLGDLHRRRGTADLAASFQARRTQLWQQWDHKLPRNVLVRHELDEVSVSRASR